MLRTAQQPTSGRGRPRVGPSQAMGAAAVDEYERRCAFPGCDVAIEDVAGRPARRYCTAAHRAAARQARRAAVQSGQEAQLAAMLPWLREPDPAEPEPAGSGPAGHGHVGEPTPPDEDSAPRVEGARVHRRRVADPVPATPGARTAGLHAPMPRHRRALAVLGAAGILAGGYAVSSAQPPEALAPAQSAPEQESEAQWAGRARVALASVNRQLDSIAQVEAEWFAMPEQWRATSPSAAVEELGERKALLERRRATLRSQLDTYQSIGDARTGLAESEQYLASVEDALAEKPTSAQRALDQEATLAALHEQRDLRLRQRDARRDELAALEGGVADAAARPLPDDVEETTDVGNEVLDVIHGVQDEAPPAPESMPTRPDVVGTRDEQEGAPRQDVDTSGPPDPRGPGDETVEPDVEPPTDRAEPAPPAPDDGSPAADTGGPTENGRDRDRDRAAERPVDPATEPPTDGSAPPPSEEPAPDPRPAPAGNAAPAESEPAAPAEPAPPEPERRGPVDAFTDGDDADGPEDRGGGGGPVDTVVDSVLDTLDDVADGPRGRPIDREREQDGAAPDNETYASDGEPRGGDSREEDEVAGDDTGSDRSKVSAGRPAEVSEQAIDPVVAITDGDRSADDSADVPEPVELRAAPQRGGDGSRSPDDEEPTVPDRSDTDDSVPVAPASATSGSEPSDRSDPVDDPERSGGSDDRPDESDDRPDDGDGSGGGGSDGAGSGGGGSDGGDDAEMSGDGRAPDVAEAVELPEEYGSEDLDDLDLDELNEMTVSAGYPEPGMVDDDVEESDEQDGSDTDDDRAEEHPVANDDVARATPDADELSDEEIEAAVDEDEDASEDRAQESAADGSGADGSGADADGSDPSEAPDDAPADGGMSSDGTSGAGSGDVDVEESDDGSGGDESGSGESGSGESGSGESDDVESGGAEPLAGEDLGDDSAGAR